MLGEREPILLGKSKQEAFHIQSQHENYDTQYAIQTSISKTCGDRKKTNQSKKSPNTKGDNNEH